MLRYLIIGLLRGYQRFISLSLPFACRFEPSCSEYALQAIQKYGVIKGCWKAGIRIIRCNPLNQHSGYDPLS